MTDATEARAQELGTWTVDELQEIYDYLDDLRESGVTNMYGAGTYLREDFGMDKQHSHKVLGAWMKEFGGRTHKIGE